VYPHLQDTGGFFIAVLGRKCPNRFLTSVPRERKRGVAQTDGDLHSKRLRLDPDTSPGSGSAELEEFKKMEHDVDIHSPVGPQSPAGLPAQKQHGDVTFKENPYTILRPNDLILRTCIERLHLTPYFPVSNILVRNPAGEPARSLYLVNDLVKSIIENNDYKRIRLTAAGTKVMAKQDAGKGAEPQFRVLGEGLPVILPFVEPSTIIESDLASLRILLSSYYPLVSSFDEPFRETMRNCPTGSHILKFPPGTVEGGRLEHELVLPIWKSNVSLTLMIDKKAKSALSLRLFGLDITSKKE
jgi:multisite-specific tRNA:(cytosine-C5)-methyltransferase